jgi:hypothetical protein
VAELQARESQYLSELEDSARALQARDPRLSFAVAYARACLENPQIYAKYKAIRERLSSRRIAPRLRPNVDDLI